MPEEVESRIEKTRRILETLNYHLNVSAQTPVEYMSTDTIHAKVSRHIGTGTLNNFQDAT
ncbi:hypothetical protein [Thermofilum sp.]|uniref:hypothetical protein n=1 Tax=Thermofilum sp. TaxID=1961369 RepID=UPI00258381E2|nr:hypothetical protein [Thermofilum sp.]